MSLLIRRDETFLSITDGTIEVDKDVPKNLRNVYIMPPAAVILPASQSLEDKLIIAPEDFADSNKYLSTKIKHKLMALWSGYRSALVRGCDGLLYRLKGVAWNIEHPSFEIDWDGSYEIFGGQNDYSARYEAEMSDEFNKMLAKEGIEPVMECKGYWHYLGEVREQKLSASIIRIKGDTRVDELMWAIDRCINGKKFETNEFSAVLGSTASFYHDLGFIVGQLKMLMTRNYQTWGAHEERTNAHIGNIVLYKCEDKIKVGFVDFDASCAKKDLSLAKLHKLMKVEYRKVGDSALQIGVESIRTAHADNFHQFDYARSIFNNNFNQYCDRIPFVQGFKNGYATRKVKDCTRDGIPAERFYEIAKLLRGKNPVEKPKISYHRAIADSNTRFNNA